MQDLITWLRSVLREDEIMARAVPVNARCVPPAHWSVSTYGPDKGRVVMGTADDFALPTPEHAQYVARFDPATVLADVRAKGELLSVYEMWFMGSSMPDSGERYKGAVEGMEKAIRTFASAYRHRPGWNTDWEK
ncbi:DUF6221 family protein [Nocardiopsis eucommiae]|uniref:DUF6221 family protein n=1 Tax=Nocardiopsis eucommiae TaxID=2831970 RepID=UPI003D743CAE